MTPYIDPTRESFAAFRDIERDGLVHMLNLLRFRECANYEDGTFATGAEAYAAYGEASEPILKRIGGRQIWIGLPELMLIGPPEEHWDLAFIAEYPSGAAFVEMLRDPEYRLAVRHRQAAVADSRLIRMYPAEPGSRFGETI